MPSIEDKNDTEDDEMEQETQESEKSDDEEESESGSGSEEDESSGKKIFIIAQKAAEDTQRGVTGRKNSFIVGKNFRRLNLLT